MDELFLLDQCPPWRPMHPLAASDMCALEAYLSAVHIIADGSVGLAHWQAGLIRFRVIPLGKPDQLECSVSGVRGLTRAGLPVWLNDKPVTTCIAIDAQPVSGWQVDVWVTVNPEVAAAEENAGPQDSRKWQLGLALKDDFTADPICNENQLFLGCYAVKAENGTLRHSFSKRPSVMRLNTLEDGESQAWLAPLHEKIKAVRTALAASDERLNPAAAVALDRLALMYPRMTIRALTDELLLIGQLLGSVSTIPPALSEVVSDRWPAQLAALLGEPDFPPIQDPKPPLTPDTVEPLAQQVSARGILFSQRTLPDGKQMTSAFAREGLDSGTYKLRISGYSGDITIKHPANVEDIPMKNILRTHDDESTTYQFAMIYNVPPGNALNIIGIDLPKPLGNYSLTKLSVG